MKNKNVGALIIGISIVIGAIVLIFYLGLKNIATQSCTHGATCAMYDTIATQTYVSLGIAALILVIGLFIFFAKEEKEVVVKRIKPVEMREIKKKFKEQDLKKFDRDEREVLKMILLNEGSMLQSELVSKTGFGKVKVTRLLDCLEGKGVIERKRRGMSNVVMLK